MRNGTSWILVPLLSAALAAGVAWMLAARADRPAPRLTFGEDPLAGVHLLAERVRRLEEQPRPAASMAPVRVDATGDATTLAECISRLEHRLTALEEYRGDLEHRRDVGQRMRLLATEATDDNARHAAALQASAAGDEAAAIERARALLADPRASAADKVEAHLRLRRVPDAYSEAMVRDLVRIGTGDQDPAIRAKVWTAFDGATRLPQIVPDLLRAVYQDQDGAVRTEAAETLAKYIDEHGVEVALRHVAETDRDSRVVARVRRELSRFGR